MNRAQLIERLADELIVSKARAAEALDAVLGCLVQAMRAGEDVRLVGFGTFFVSDRETAEGRNPATGEALVIPAARTVRFRAGTALKTALNDGR